MKEVGKERFGEWRTCSPEENAKPNTVYYFNYTIPRRDWWQFWRWHWGFNPEKFKEDVKKQLAKDTGIPEKDIFPLWYRYIEEKFPDRDGSFEIQIEWIPHGIEPAVGFLIPLTIWIVSISIPLTAFIIVRLGGKPALDTIKELAEETTKITKYSSIIAGIICAGYLIPLFVPKKKGG